MSFSGSGLTAEDKQKMYAFAPTAFPSVQRNRVLSMLSKMVCINEYWLCSLQLLLLITVGILVNSTTFILVPSPLLTMFASSLVYLAIAHNCAPKNEPWPPACYQPQQWWLTIYYVVWKLLFVLLSIPSTLYSTLHRHQLVSPAQQWKVNALVTPSLLGIWLYIVLSFVSIVVVSLTTRCMWAYNLEQHNQIRRKKAIRHKPGGNRVGVRPRGTAI